MVGPKPSPEEKDNYPTDFYKLSCWFRDHGKAARATVAALYAKRLAEKKAALKTELLRRW